MAAPFTVSPAVGVDLKTIFLATDISANNPSRHRLGEQVFASDGRIYVYAQANASIGASTAVAAINTSTFLATATTGAYLSPATAMVTGDQGWFGRAAV